MFAIKNTATSKHILCNRTHIVAFTENTAAQRVATILKTPRTYLTSSSCHLDYCGTLKSRFESETKPALLRYGLCPDRMAFLETRQAQLIVHRNIYQEDAEYKILPSPELVIDKIHPYTLFAMPVYEFTPLVVAGDLVGEKEDILAFDAILVENSKKLPYATRHKTTIDPHQSGMGFFLYRL